MATWRVTTVEVSNTLHTHTEVLDVILALEGEGHEIVSICPTIGTKGFTIFSRKS